MVYGHLHTPTIFCGHFYGMCYDMGMNTPIDPPRPAPPIDPAAIACADIGLKAVVARSQRSWHKYQGTVTLRLMHDRSASTLGAAAKNHVLVLLLRAITHAVHNPHLPGAMDLFHAALAYGRQLPPGAEPRAAVRDAPPVMSENPTSDTSPPPAAAENPDLRPALKLHE